MKRCILMLLCLLSLQKVEAQITDSIVGSWKVTRVQLAKGTLKSEEMQVEVINKIFLNSTFHFKGDHHFTYDIAQKELRIKNGHWKYVTKSKSYIIQDWKDKAGNDALLMEIFMVRKGDKVFFVLTESPYILEVEKENE